MGTPMSPNYSATATLQRHAVEYHSITQLEKVEIGVYGPLGQYNLLYRRQDHKTGLGQVSREQEEEEGCRESE